MYCDNEIKREELDNIYRIEYMPTSNWVMGAQRMIWVVELSEEEVHRSVYIGSPLVPEYRAYMSRNEEVLDTRAEMIREGKLAFANHFESYYYYEFLDGCEVWNWARQESDIEVIDGEIYDIAFFTKDSEGKDKICRYQFTEVDLDPWITNQFDAFFDTVPAGIYEPVTINREMEERSQALLPGNYEDEERISQE